MDLLDNDEVVIDRRLLGSRTVTILLIVVGFFGLLAWILVFEVKASDLKQVFTEPLWLVGGSFCLILPFLVHVIRYKLMLNRVIQVSWGFVYTMVMSCTFLNHFVVAKIGDFAEPLWLKNKVGLPYWEGLQVGLVRFAHSALALAVLAGAALSAWAPADSPVQRWSPLLIATACSLLGLLCLRYLGQRFERSGALGPGTSRGGWLNRVVAGFMDLLRAAGRIPFGQQVVLVGLACVEVSIDALPYALFALACGVELPLAPLLTAAAALNVIEYVPTPPALLGVQSWAATLSMLPAAVPVGVLAGGLAVHRTFRTILIATLGIHSLYRLARENHQKLSEGLTKSVSTPGQTP